MPAVNSVHLVGNLSQDAELRYTNGGAAVLNFAIGVNNRIPINNQRDEWKEVVAWVNVSIYGPIAEILQPRLHKGTEVYVDGKLWSDEWTTPEGLPRTRLVVRANAILVGERHVIKDEASVEAQFKGGAPV